MILTGESRQKFEQWYWNDWLEDGDRSKYLYDDAIIWLWKSEKMFLFPLIIEWLDSVGIYVEISGVQYQSDSPEFTYNIQEIGTLNGFTKDVFSTRQQATEKAIERAVEIYNSK